MKWPPAGQTIEYRFSFHCFDGPPFDWDWTVAGLPPSELEAVWPHGPNICWFYRQTSYFSLKNKQKIEWNSTWTLCAPQGPTQWHVQILMEKLLRTVNRTIIEMDPDSPYIVSQQLSRTQTHTRILFHLERRWRPSLHQCLGCTSVAAFSSFHRPPCKHVCLSHSNVNIFLSLMSFWRKFCSYCVASATWCCGQDFFISTHWF